MKKLSPSLQESVQARQGAECVYLEKAYIIHARLDEVRADAWGVRLRFRDLYTPGFTGDARPQAVNPFWTVSASWEVFSDAAESWSASYAGWSVYFSVQFIERIREAAQGVAGADLRSRYEALVKVYQGYRPNQ